MIACASPCQEPRLIAYARAANLGGAARLCAVTVWYRPVCAEENTLSSSSSRAPRADMIYR